MIFDVTRAVDSSRPVIESSGWSHTVPNPMVLDRHDYEHDAAKLAAKWHDFFTAGPPKLAMPPRYGTTGGEPADAGTPYWVSEMGGIGWSSEKRTLYGSMPKSLDAFYKEFDGVVGALMDNPNFFGFCYTQLTDVEEEKNGIYYFDRTPKFDPARLRAALTRPAAYESGKGMAPPPKPPAAASDWTVLIGALPRHRRQGAVEVRDRDAGRRLGEGRLRRFRHGNPPPAPSATATRPPPARCGPAMTSTSAAPSTSTRRR